LRHVLLDEKQRGAVGDELAKEVEDFIDDDGGKTHRYFVEQYDRRARYVGAGKGKHLLFAAAHRSGDLASTLAEFRESGDGALDCLGFLAPPCKEPEVLLHGQRGEDAASLGDVTDAEPSDGGRAVSRHV